MRLENAVASEVLERILSAYGFTMQKELSDRLEIAKSNVASWLARGQVPGNVIVQCSLDTGADVNWLVTGRLEKTSFIRDFSKVSGKDVYDEVMANGGKPVLRRILDAYGFTQQKQLCELLNISSGTVSTWIRRDYFPGDVVVSCAIDTGVSLRWLATGKGEPFINENMNSSPLSIIRKDLSDGILKPSGFWLCDLSFITRSIISPIFIRGNFYCWVVDMGVKSISDGKWLLGIDDKCGIYDVSLLPDKNINVKSSTTDFKCRIEQVNFLGKVVLSMDLVS